jgi:hypothetical protein
MTVSKGLDTVSAGLDIANIGAYGSRELGAKRRPFRRRI